MKQGRGKRAATLYDFLHGGQVPPDLEVQRRGLGRSRPGYRVSRPLAQARGVRPFSRSTGPARASPWAARRNRQLDAVGFGAAGNLAGQPRRTGFHRQRHVQHVDFRLRRLRQFVVPAIRHVDMAGGAGAGPATFCRDIQPAVAQDFHHAPAVAAFQFMHLAGAVGGDNFQATPNFFCRLEEEVVYWKRSFSFGLAMWKAAWAINAASWKPDNISFTCLPAGLLMSPMAENARRLCFQTAPCPPGSGFHAG